MHMSTGDSKKKGLPKVCVSVISMTFLHQKPLGHLTQPRNGRVIFTPSAKLLPDPIKGGGDRVFPNQ